MKFSTEGQQSLTDVVDGFNKLLLEMTYRNKAFNYFGWLLRRAKVTKLFF